MDDEDTDATDVVRWYWSDGSIQDYRFDTKITIGFDGRTIRGRLESSKGQCVRFREVVIKRKKDGKVVVFRRVHTAKDGGWAIAAPSRVHGWFYAKVRQYQWTMQSGAFAVCDPDRSRTIRVR